MQPTYYDHTRKSSFFKCPRAYYFRHIRHWAPEKVSQALTFGGGIHEGMEVIWGVYQAGTQASRREIVDAAMIAFLTRWEADGLSTDEALMMDNKRTPGIAMEIFDNYLMTYGEWLERIEVLAVEQPFLIPLDEEGNFFFIGRWDKVYKEGKRVYVSEHKTTSVYRVNGIFAREWVESFSPDDQVDGYAYAGSAVYGDAFSGVIVDGIMVHKSVRGFKRIPISKRTANLEAWHWETIYWINEIEENLKIIREHPDIHSLPFLPAFPKRTEHCQHKYGTCTYQQICRYSDANPENIIDVPKGFKEETWDPFAHNIDEAHKPMIVGAGG